jgi:hypothetical protein
LREKQKADRQKEIEKRRNLASFVQDAEKRGKDHESAVSNFFIFYVVQLRKTNFCLQRTFQDNYV